MMFYYPYSKIKIILQGRNIVIFLIFYFNYSPMEEYEESCSDSIYQEEQSLLSFKMRELEEKSISQTQKTLFSDSLHFDRVLEETRQSKEGQRLVKNKLTSSLPLSRVSDVKKGTKLSVKRQSSLQTPKGSVTPLKRKKYPRRQDMVVVKPEVRKVLTTKFVKTSQKGDTGRMTVYEPFILSELQIEGYGTLIASNGYSFQGDWVTGIPVGLIKIRSPKGSVYEGQVYNLRSHGKGKLTYASGKQYIGEFCYGDAHGEGILYNRQGKIICEGEWKRGKYVE